MRRAFGAAAGCFKPRSRTHTLCTALPPSQDIKERVFGKTDAASAMTTILSRDPSFDMSKLLASVKKDAPVVRT